MKILFVHPATSMSIGDVGRGYRTALERAGHDIRDYNLRARFAYHGKAIPAEITDRSVLSRQACETILNEALYHKAEMVLIISGLNVHPIALWLLGQVGIPAAVILTESPYNDEDQAKWIDLSHVNATVDLKVFTNDRYSAMKNGWHLLAPAYDINIHKPVAPDPEMVCDAVMVGTGWLDRQAMLEAVDWEGIDLRLYGIWPDIKPDSPLSKFYRPMVVNNESAVTMYASARICLNINRRDPTALTPGPRAYELAACGAFQMSDPRKDMTALFGDSVPVFNSPAQLEEMIRHYLQQPEERMRMAAEARERVKNETFDHRAANLIAALSTTQSLIEKGA